MSVRNIRIGIYSGGLGGVVFGVMMAMNRQQHRQGRESGPADRGRSGQAIHLLERSPVPTERLGSSWPQVGT